MKIVILEAYALNLYDLDWQELYTLTSNIVIYSRTEYDEIADRIKDADIVVCNKCNIDAHCIRNATNLRLIAVTATGTDRQDLAACRAQNIAVANVPSYSTHSVAQLTFALLLQICQSTAAHEKALRDGYWQLDVPPNYGILRQTELYQKTLGLIGFGNIARQVAAIATAFGMQVLVHTRTIPSEKIDNVTFTNLDNLFAQSDIISLHCPLTENTRFLICRDNIEKMKDGVIIINTARGSLVCEQDLSSAIKSDKVSAYGADVLSDEPALNTNPLLHTPHVYLTPHIAWATEESLARLCAEVVTNIKSFLDGKPRNIVN